MQDKYFGDEGDFVKFRLLRKICGMPHAKPQLSLGVVWYLVKPKDESENSDGGLTAYLDQPENNEVTDPDLFRQLRMWVRSGGRRVSLLENSCLFPTATGWYAELVPASRLSDRTRSRGAWLQRALAAVAESRIVFLDPDNGLAPPSVKKHHAKACKYAFPDELRDFCSSEGNPTVVVYQHWRRVRAIRQISEQIREIRDCSGRDHVVAVMDRRLSRRLFYVIPSERDRDLVLCRMGEIATLTSLPVAIIGS